MTQQQQPKDKDNVTEPAHDRGLKAKAMAFYKASSQFASTVSSAFGSALSSVRKAAGQFRLPVKPAGSFKKERLLPFTLIGVSALYLVGVPLVQPYLVKVWQLAPIWFVPILTVPIVLLITKKSRAKLAKKSALLGGTVAASAALCALLLVANTAPWFVQSQMAASLRPVKLSEISQTENLRILGQGTASWYLHSKNRDNRLETVGLPQLARECSDNSCSLWWQSAYSFKTGRLGSWLPRLLGSSQSILRINASELETSSEANSGANTKFLFGEESAITETLFRLHHPLSQRVEATYYRSPEDKWSLLIPYISYRPTMTGTMLPVLGGVMEVNQWGWISDHTVADAARLFPGSVLYPSVLARQYGEAYGHYRTGLLNVWLNESGIDQISEDTPKAGENQQPYIQSFVDSAGRATLQEVIALEPAGKQSFGLSELLFFDAQTGKTQVYEVPAASDLNGPRRALKQATNADPETDWTAYSVQEPRLVVRNGDSAGSVKRYWLMTQVKNEGDDHTAVRVILTDMETLKTIGFNSRSEMEHFISSASTAE
ncbi:MAG: hypothetical protein Q8T09_01705 [Candidatus Melainabacteria bacterium]|nr:hypothetical protein [Candidatus Melainabacteria bacterium]